MCSIKHLWLRIYVFSSFMNTFLRRLQMDSKNSSFIVVLDSKPLKIQLDIFSLMRFNGGCRWFQIPPETWLICWTNVALFTVSKESDLRAAIHMSVCVHLAVLLLLIIELFFPDEFRYSSGIHHSEGSPWLAASRPAASAQSTQLAALHSARQREGNGPNRTTAWCVSRVLILELFSFEICPPSFWNIIRQTRQV